jgi:amino acid adenylation domain-containing protein
MTVALSDPQRALWFMHELAPDADAFNTVIAARVRGPLDAAALRRAAARLAARHAVLRGRVVVEAGEPRLRVLDADAPPVIEATADDDAALLAALRGAVARPFDLRRGSPARVHVVRRGPDDAGLALVVHHIAVDLEALATSFDELLLLHDAERRGVACPLAPPAGEYAAWAAEQEARLRGPEGARLGAFWGERLRGAPTLQLPIDRPRPRRRSLGGSHHAFTLPAAQVAALRGLARAAGASLASALLAAWGVLLARLAGQEGVVVGVSAAGRRGAAGLTGVVGTFVNTLPVLMDMSGETSFRALLAAAHAGVRAAVEHEDYPLHRMVEQLAPTRDPSRPPLFQAAFALQRVPRLQESGLAPLLAPAAAGARVTRAGLELEALALSQQNGQHDLALWALEWDGALHCELKYDGALFEAASVEGFARRFAALLANLVAAPDLPLTRVSLCTAEERAALVAGWSRPLPRYPARPLHAWFAEQAARAPDRVAVTCAGASLTYGELDRRANRVAQRLLAAGVARGARVGLCTERSLELVAGVLGILKAGAAYVPMDPHYPAERLAFLARDAACPAIVADVDGARRLPAGAAVVRVDDLAGAPDVDPCVPSDPGDLAYVIYTSGSTGVPKGVLVTHANVARLLTATEAWYHFGEADVWTLFHSFAFDVSVWELFGALLTGGRLVVVPQATTRAPDEMLALLRDERATVLNLTPSAFTQLDAADAAQPGTPLALRWLIFAGETLEPTALAGWFARRGDAAPRVVNMYGITETTVHVTYREIRRGDLARASSPIGVAIPDLQLCLLDAAGEPVPPGVPGEIYVGGAGVARGYHERPELTAARFVAAPWGEGRLYRSGDLARIRGDGELEFLGRADAQVKIRGFRVEPGEIEAALRACPEVAEVRVVPRDDGPRGKRIVAYMVARAGRTIDVRALRARLAAELPPQLVPSGFAVLPALPLTAHGKLDARALPDPAPLAEPDAEPPRGPTELRLAAVFAEVLGVAVVGRDVGFFELGGHSLQAQALRAAIEREFGARLAIAAIFEAPTVAGLAAAIAAARPAAPAAAAAIEPDRKDMYEPFPLTDAQAAYWVGRGDAFALGGVGSHVYWEFEAAALDVARLERALRQVIARHGMLRAVVRPDGLQQVLAEVPAYTIAAEDLRGGEDAPGRLAATRAAMAAHVFRPDRWPLFEVRATLLPGGAVRLHLGFDALIVDAASIYLVLSEWAALYADPAAALPTAAIGFRDYVLAARRHAEGPAFRAAAEYWAARLEELPPAPALPLARAPAPGEAPRFERRSARLPAARWQALQARGRREGLTPSGLLCAAFAEVLGAWGGGERFLLNLTTFSRLPVHPDVDRVVGDFTSILLLAVDRAAPSFAGRARALQARLAADLEHADYSGVQVLREARRRGIELSAPVVFTSALVHQRGFPALLGRRVEGLAQTPQVWLDHVVFEEDGDLVCVWDAVEALFPAGVLSDMFAAYTGLLGELADDAARWSRAGRALVPAAQLAERAAANATAGPAPAGLLHSGFLAQAELRPDAPAVIADDGALSYAGLRARARRLAAGLRAAGVRPGDRVAIALERGADQVAAALAVSLAGGAYVPVDPGLPPARIERLVALCGAAIVITREGQAAPPGTRALTLADAAGEADAPLPEVAGPGDLAYVIYTSGSTGEPKGVMIEHRAALGTIADINRRFAVGPADRVLALSSPSFDLSVYDVFGLLAAGGALVIPAADAARDPARWSALARAHAVTIWNSVPALMEMFVGWVAGRRELAAPALRLALLSGDWIPVRLPDAIRAAHPGAAVVSLGGATEAAIWSIVRPVEAVDPAWTSVPYGRPLTGQRFHVLDARREPCPTHVPGQLYIAGDGLARGYLGDAERTAASFVTLPDGERAYRTGDLGRYLPGGEIEFLGREDAQVKIQGYRVELGEIEAALAQHPEVAAAAAVARGEARGGKQLVAYVVPAPGSAPALERPPAPPDGRPRVALPRPAPDLAALRARQSVRAWTAAPVPLSALAALLSALAPAALPETPLPKRRYPSAGGLYPVHACVLAAPGRVEGLPAGAYRLDAEAGALVELSPGTCLSRQDHSAYNQAFAGDAAFAVALVADVERLAPSYAGRARDFCLIEAGAIVQLLQGEAPAAGLGLCQLGSLASEGPLRAALGLAGGQEVVAWLVGGGVAAGQLGRVTPAPAKAPLAARLREHLAATLPGYMVPAAIVLLEALPLSRNGKLDRARLPAPGDEGPRAAGEPPAGPREQAVAAVVREVVGAEVAADVPLFVAGATSLHLVQIHARLRERLGVELAITEVFRHPTIRALAARLGPAPAEDGAAARRGEDRARARAQARRQGRS